MQYLFSVSEFYSGYTSQLVVLSPQDPLGCDSFSDLSCFQQPWQFWQVPVKYFVEFPWFSSVTQSCLTLWDRMDYSSPGLPVHHQFPEFTQTHVHRVSDAIQPSHPLSSPSPPALNLSQHQGHFKWVSSSHEVAKVLEFQLQHRSFQWTFRTDFLSDGLVGSPCSPRDSQKSSPTPQFKSISSSALSFLYSPTLTSIHDHWEFGQVGPWN